jgi:hypothetical protein
VYYAFFETKDRQFFTKLMSAFCSIYVQNIVDLYNAVKQKKSNVLDVEIYKLDREDLDKHMEKRKKILNFFNCSQHLRTADCLNNACMAEHTSVLAEDQADEMESLMKKAKNDYCKKHYPGEQKKVWLEILEVFHSHNVHEFYKMKVLSVESANDPIKYSEEYIEAVKKINPAPTGCAYVRSGNTSASGFVDFQARAPDVAACDILQTV